MINISPSNTLKCDLNTPREKLSVSDRNSVTVDVFLVLQVGEVWEEVSRELGLDGVRPTTPDEEALSAVCKISEDTARTVAAEQRSILELQEKEDISEEQLMYTEVLSKLNL